MYPTYFGTQYPIDHSKVTVSKFSQLTASDSNPNVSYNKITYNYPTNSLPPRILEYT